MVGEYGQCSELAHVRVPLPLDPAVMLTGIIPEECSVFKSALSPLRLTFRTAGASITDTKPRLHGCTTLPQQLSIAISLKGCH